MKLPTEVFGDVVVVHTPEELGTDTAVQLEQFLTSLERSNAIVVLDGSETIDPGGLEALIGAQEALRALQGDLKISTSNPANRKILEITRLDEQVEVYDTVINAGKSFA